tara:strand:- start:306 stop:515 length:210 start_codon:yes stop_codon:yes gene_type:complete
MDKYLTTYGACELIASSLGKKLHKRGSKYIINNGGFSTGIECENLGQVAKELAIKVQYLHDMYYEVKKG